MPGAPSSPEVAATRNALGNLIRWHGADAEAVDEARRALKFAVMADYLTRQMDGMPALTAEQVERLVLVLRGDEHLAEPVGADQRLGGGADQGLGGLGDRP